MSFIQISKVLNKRFQGTNLSKQVSATLVCEEFDKIILEIWGDKINHQAQAMYLKDRILTIASLSSVVAQEIKLRERKLLELLAGKFGPGAVEGIRILT